MSKFIIRELTNSDIIEELEKVGFDYCYREKGKEKYIYKNLKIYSLKIAQANILKQLALSVGADCATHKKVITGEIESSNVILGGSISQLKKIAEKLKLQPFSLRELASEILALLNISHSKTKVVGILNITDNSFSDGGKYIETNKAIEHLYQLIQDGADVIDIGAESTKLNAKEISAKMQLKRILPVLEKIDTKKIIISIDTRSSKVAEECLKHGAKIINDVSGLKYDQAMANVVAKYNATVIIQHSKNRKNQGSNVEQTPDIIEDVYMDLKKQIEYAISKGIKNIIIDVGIGFDKTEQDNFDLIKHIDEFKSLGYPIMLGVSRKSFLKTNDYKDAFTLAINSLAIEHGIDYIRVHDVKLHKDFINILR